MIEKGMTVREAAHRWVQEMDFIQTDMIEKLMGNDPEEWNEVTTPAKYDKVYVYKIPEGGRTHEGEIVDYDDEGETYCIELDDGKTVNLPEDDFAVEREGWLPMWGTMWSFRDSCDTHWLEEGDGIEALSRCGFRVFESEEFGYFFGIDGAGYDFYEDHWIPLYNARGLEWHDPMTESGSFVMKEWRKADLYDHLLGCLTELIGSSEELVNVLKGLGFSDNEIAFEGLEVLD